MYSLRSTILLLIILIVPFFLRKISLEPYPSVLLPDFALTVRKINNRVKIVYKQMYGVDHHGKWKQIEPVKLIYPVPLQYWTFIIDDFEGNLDTSQISTKRFKILHILRLADVPHIQKQFIFDRDRWLKNRLLEQQLGITKIRIVVFSKTINAQTGGVIDNLITDEKIIYLLN